MLHPYADAAANMQVAGNFHFAPGKSFQQGAVHVHDLVPFRDVQFDTSHIIDKLSFGVEYPGMANPLDKTRVSKQNTRNPAGLPGAYQYFLKVAGHLACTGSLLCSAQTLQGHTCFAAAAVSWQQSSICDEQALKIPVLLSKVWKLGACFLWLQVVPTTYIDSHNKTIQSNQYSVTEHFKPTVDPHHGGQLPGVFIFYDLSPIKVFSPSQPTLAREKDSALLKGPLDLGVF